MRARRPRQRAEDHVFDPVLVGHRECDAWVAYYRRDWARLMVASVGLVSAGFGMGRARTVAGAWHVFRANRSWSPYPDNHPKRARTCMRRFYGLVRLTYGEPSNPAKAAELEVDWWRVHRELQHDPGRSPDELVEALVRLYTYLYGDPEAELRPAAAHRAKAMELSDQWVSEGCQPDSELLPLEHAALVRAYAALLAAVHH